MTIKNPKITMSSCAYCGGSCSAHADENSHGICLDCLVKVSPDCPTAKLHIKAMKRGLKRMVDAGLNNLVQQVNYTQQTKEK
jgi:hypothetical protein